MANADLPTHVTLVANTVSTVTVNGMFTHLDCYNQTSGTIVYARGDGANPTVGGDECWPIFPVPADDTDVPTMTTDGATTTIKLISSGTPTVSILPCDCDCD